MPFIWITKAEVYALPAVAFAQAGASSGGGGFGGGSPPTIKVRKEFPEVFIWDDLISDTSENKR